MRSCALKLPTLTRIDSPRVALPGFADARGSGVVAGRELWDG